MQPFLERLVLLQSGSAKSDGSALTPALEQVEAAERSRRFFENLSSELHATAVGVAVATTGVNALQDWRIVVAPADIARFAPQSSGLKALLSVLRDNEALGALCAHDIAVFVGDLEAARAQLDHYLDECETLSPDRAASVHASRLQGIWRPLCRVAKELVHEVDTCLPVQLPELYQQNSLVLSALLTGAANGLRPCLDAKGRLYVPPLPQKRQWPRRSILQDCIVHSESGKQTAFVRDASAGGLGLGRVKGLRRGDRIRVEMANGRMLHGAVVWSSAGSAGIRFDEPLAATDLLIAV